MAKKSNKKNKDFGWYNIDLTSNKVTFDRLAWHDLLSNSNIRRDNNNFYLLDGECIDYSFEPTDDFICAIKTYLKTLNIEDYIINNLLCTSLISNIYQKAVKKLDVVNDVYRHLTFPFFNKTFFYDYIVDESKELKSNFKQEFFPVYYDAENKKKFVNFSRIEGAESDDFTYFLKGISSFKNEDNEWVLDEVKYLQNRIKIGKFFLSNIVKEIWDDNWCTWITDINPAHKGGSGKSLLVKILGLIYCSNRSVTFDGRNINLNDNHVWSAITPNVTMVISLQDFDTDEKTSINKFLNILSGDAMTVNKKNIDIQNIEPKFVPQASFSSNYLPNGLFNNDLIKRRIDVLILSDFFSDADNKVPHKLLRWNDNFEWNLFFNQIIDMIIFSIRNKDELIPIPEEIYSNTTLSTKAFSNFSDSGSINKIDDLIEYFDNAKNIVMDLKDLESYPISKNELIKFTNDILSSRRSKYYITISTRINKDGKRIKILKKKLGQKFKEFEKKINFDKNNYFKKKGKDIDS